MTESMSGDPWTGHVLDDRSMNTISHTAGPNKPIKIDSYYTCYKHETCEVLMNTGDVLIWNSLSDFQIFYSDIIPLAVKLGELSITR